MKRFSTPMIALASIALAGLGACSDETVNPGTSTITVPATYSFASRFDASKSSVEYSGQTVRNLLIQDLISSVSALGKPGATPTTEAELLARYEHSDAANLTTKVTVSGKELLESQYNRIATDKRLSDKISTDMVIGMNTSADALVRGWLRTAALNSQDPLKLGTPAAILDENGLDMGEMIGKVLFGAVSYYQATTVYLGNVVTKDNVVAADDGNGGKLPYTTMEHNWDEAFGYFGAARDYARYTDALLTGTSAQYSFDTDGDGRIDLRSEYNYTIARYAARRDQSSPGTDFTKEIFDAFLKGRTAIANQGTSAEINAQRVAVCDAWEKIMAASLVHYLNGVKAEMAEVGQADFDEAGLRHEWSEMKGFAIALQYNVARKISDAQLAQIHTLIGTTPQILAAGTQANGSYVAALDAVRALVQGVYGFTDAQMNAW